MKRSKRAANYVSSDGTRDEKVRRSRITQNGSDRYSCDSLKSKSLESKWKRSERARAKLPRAPGKLPGNRSEAGKPAKKATVFQFSLDCWQSLSGCSLPMKAPDETPQEVQVAGGRYVTYKRRLTDGNARVRDQYRQSRIDLEGS